MEYLPQEPNIDVEQENLTIEDYLKQNEYVRKLERGKENGYNVSSVTLYSNIAKRQKMMNKLNPEEYDSDILYELRRLGTRLESKMDNLESRMSNLESRMSNLESRMDNLESRMDNLETNVNRIDNNLLSVLIHSARISNNSSQIKNKEENSTIFLPILNTNPSGSGAIGTSPLGHPQSKHELDTLRTNQIESYQVFYGNDFGIISSDTPQIKRQKYIEWLKKQ